ncbi:MAG: hypothetical protein IJ489_09805 [Clostridia bacterium]|nr:hypothetical protein [Clostridia bacterium]
MNLYKEYMQNKFDLSTFGLEKREWDGYFCTPEDAGILGWTGVDGIHYCTVKTLGETVFCVDPMGDYGRYVFPVAENFEIFLRLLIACKDEAYIGQAHAWTKEEYRTITEEATVSPEAEAVIADLKHTYGLSPMDEPYIYLKRIYDNFDYHTIPYRDEYYEYVPREEAPQEKEWKVWFSFNDHKGGEKAGEALPLDAQFTWGGYAFYIPCAYVCGKGLVLDIFAEADTETARTYLFKELYADDGQTDMENPFAFDYRTYVTVNGNRMREKSSQCGYWAKGYDSYESEDVREILMHYGLDTEKCFLYRRIRFPWATKSRPKIKNLTVSMEQRPISMKGERFRVNGIGQEITFKHPITKTEHILTVREYEESTMDFSRSDGYEHPTHCTQMSYTLSPTLSATQFYVSDTRHSDLPRKMKVAQKEKNDFESALALIGGADGPTAVFAVRKQTAEDLRSACSSLTFKPRTDVEWQMIFREKTLEDTEVVLFLK